MSEGIHRAPPGGKAAVSGARQQERLPAGKVRRHDKMKMNTIGANERHIPNFDLSRTGNRRPLGRKPGDGSLSRPELRRLVAAMID